MNSSTYPRMCLPLPLTPAPRHTPMHNGTAGMLGVALKKKVVLVFGHGERLG